jgi:hypothetical protein
MRLLYKISLSMAALVLLAIQKRLKSYIIVALANRVLPVATCFTGTKLRVSVFSRTAIHAPGGWALIENLPNVLTGDRVTVESWSTEIPSPEDKAFVSLCADPFVGLGTQQCCAPTNPGFGSGYNLRQVA